MISATVLFGLHRWISSFDLAMKDTVLRWVVLVFVASASGLATYALESIWKLYQQGARKKKRISRLSDLTLDEQLVLRHYIEEGRKTYNFGKGGGVVDLLAHDGVLSLLASNPGPGVHCPDTYAIDPDVWKFLNANPDRIDLEPWPEKPSKSGLKA